VRIGSSADQQKQVRVLENQPENRENAVPTDVNWKGWTVRAGLRCGGIEPADDLVSLLIEAKDKERAKT